MDPKTVMMLIFAIGFVAFLVLVYTMKSPEKEEREREMHEFFKRENDKHREA